MMEIMTEMTTAASSASRYMMNSAPTEKRFTMMSDYSCSATKAMDTPPNPVNSTQICMSMRVTRHTAAEHIWWHQDFRMTQVAYHSREAMVFIGISL